ncbi:hypothetical protein PspLS_05302 [Pyricularia sp. CBS 133598]|nr:hypothetical protein PspLS_05302 [Pyricularia sp. CBS 133598]
MHELRTLSCRRAFRFRPARLRQPILGSWAVVIYLYNKNELLDPRVATSMNATRQPSGPGNNSPRPGHHAATLPHRYRCVLRNMPRWDESVPTWMTFPFSTLLGVAQI